MGLFGIAGPKKAKEMEEEINRLKSLLSPEQMQLEDIYLKIEKMKIEKEKLENAIKSNQKKIKEQEQTVERLKKQAEIYLDTIEMSEYGLYKPTFEFSNSDRYKEELSKVRDMQKDLIKSKKACYFSTNWTVNGSAAEGKKMVSDTVKLLLRAFNSECDDIIDNVKISNKEKSIERIIKLSDTISKHGRIHSIRISKEYLNLKIKELNLAIDYYQKKAEEKEKIRELKAQEREEARVQKEIAETRKHLEKEKNHYQNALNSILLKLKSDPENIDLISKKKEIENEISETDKAISDVDYRQANRKAGYVYVISNIGAFGENVYKIGMTRRLDPMERVHELGDASVPFGFDVHALIFTDDAPKLEAALHNAFEMKKVNKINHRREFFRVSLDEIKKVVRENFDNTVDWIDIPQAEQYRQSIVSN